MRRGSSLRLILSPITLVAMVYLRWIISCLRRPLDSRLCRNKAFRCYPAPVGVGLPFQRALRVHLLRRIFDCFHDMLIPRAPAQIPFQSLPDFLACGMGITAQKLIGCKDHARSAEAALQAVLLPEPFLERMEFAVAGQPFNGGYFRSISLRGQYSAGLDRFAIQQYGAGPAQGRFAAHMSSRQPGCVTKVMNQQ